MVRWLQERQLTVSPGAFVEAFEALREKPNPFAYPIEYLKPEGAGCHGWKRRPRGGEHALAQAGSTPRKASAGVAPRSP